MGRAPFFLPLVGLIFGILSSEYLPDFPFWALLPIALLGFGLYFLQRKVLSLLLLFGCVGWGVMRVHHPNPLGNVGSAYYSADVIHVSETDGNATMGIVTIDSVNREPVAPFNINIQLIGHRHVIRRGDRIAFRSSVSEPEVLPQLPDIVSENPLDRQFGVVGFSMILPDSLCYCVPGNNFKAKIYRLNQELLSRLSLADLDDNAFSLLSAMLLGDKSMLLPDEVNTYSASGLSHLLALSGTHVAVIASLIALTLFPLTLARRNVARFVLTICLLWFYAFLTGMAPSVIRASVMASVYLIGRILERNSVPINSLCFAAWIILMVDPIELFMPGFQMSFAAVAGIIIFYPLLNQIDRRRHPWLYLLWSYPAVSISAMLLTGIVAAWYFHTFPLYFLPANLFVVPLIPLILGLGALLIAAPGFYPAACAANGLCSLLAEIAGFISRLPQAIIGNVYFSLWFTVLILLLLIGCGISLHFKRWSGVIACVIIFVFACVAERLTLPQYPMNESFELNGALVVRENDSIIVFTELHNETDRREATAYFTKRLKHYCAKRNLPEPEIRPLP